MGLAILAVFTFFLAACQTQEVSSPGQLEIRPASYTQQAGWEAFVIPDSDQTVYVDPTPLLTSSDITQSRQTRDNSDQLAVNLTLTDSAGDRLYAYTRQHISAPLAIFLDGELLTSPVVRSALRKDVMITGGRNGLTPEQANAITGE